MNTWKKLLIISGMCSLAGVTPEQIYNEPENAFVADFIGESNIVPGLMIHDELVEIFGAKFACVDKGFGNNKPVDVVIRPEDIDLLKPEEGTLQGVVTHLIFKGVHYEMEVTTPMVLSGWYTPPICSQLASR